MEVTCRYISIMSAGLSACGSVGSSNISSSLIKCNWRFLHAFLHASCLSMSCFVYCVVNRDQNLLLRTGTGTDTTHAYQAQIHTTGRLQGSTYCLQRDGRCKEECGELKYQIALSQTNASGNCFVFILQCEINTF